MSLQKFPMTLNGAAKLKEELFYLINTERPVISKAIQAARELGDLKENAEYHSAKDQQGLIEAKIRHIEAQLQNAQIIDITKIPNKQRVIFGATITLTNLENDDALAVQLVGENEADLKQKKLAITSPIARACIGKHLEDVVTVKTPSGTIEYEISTIEHI